MAFRNACDPRRLERFLREQSADDTESELEAHLSDCPSCRQRLDELAGGPRWWTEIRRHLGGDGAAELGHTAGPVEASATFDLDFLEPSNRPDSLGRLGAYEVLEVLGRGGFGVVLKAFDPALNRPVAIKVLAAEYAARGAARKRFAREARAAAAVAHEHVVPVHAVDADATPPYLVMAFIPGESLQQRLDRTGPLELREALRIAMQAAFGLAAAHAQGLVHRDIKPANIMLENGIERVRLTDFGLARAVDDASITQSGAVAGTPQFMAPEQAANGPVDQRADLFALGSTLYAMCAGRAPFRGDSGWAVLRQVCEAEPQPLRSINPDVPVWLEGIVRKLHAKDPARRFASATEVAGLLEQCLAHVQQPDRHPLPPAAVALACLVPVPPRARPAHRSGHRLATVVAVAVIAGTGLLLPRIWRGRPAPDPAPLGLEAPAPGLSEDDAAWEPEELVRLRSRVRDLASPLTAASSTEAPDTALENAALRARQLRRGLGATQESALDPVGSQVASIRRRLAALQESIGKPD